MVYEDLVHNRSFIPESEHRLFLELSESAYEVIKNDLLRRGYVYVTPRGLCLSERGLKLDAALELVVKLEEEEFLSASELEGDR
jgi:hypothetical protein